MNFQTPEEAKLTILLAFSMLAAAFLITVEADAFIPSSQFIFNRVAEAHGKGPYIIEDEVYFHEGIESQMIRESWIIADGGEMRVSASGDSLRTFRLMKKGRIFWVDENGAERADEVSNDDFMRPLLTRSASEEKKFFVGWGVMPPDVLREKKYPKELKDYTYQPESFVRLSRVGGTVDYAYGTPSPQDGPLLPGLWIEQDGFVIRKMRSPDGSEMQLNDYVTFAKGLAFPKSQIVIFDNHVATVRVTKVVGGELSMDQKRQLDPSWLRSHRETQTAWPKTALGPVLQEFYKRFR